MDANIKVKEIILPKNDVVFLIVQSVLGDLEWQIIKI